MHNRSPGFSTHWLTLPFSIHGQTIEVYRPKLEMAPYSSTMRGWESFFQILSSQLRHCKVTRSEEQYQTLREVKPTYTRFAFNTESLVVFRRDMTAAYGMVKMEIWVRKNTYTLSSHESSCCDTPFRISEYAPSAMGHAPLWQSFQSGWAHFHLFQRRKQPTTATKDIHAKARPGRTLWNRRIVCKKRGKEAWAKDGNLITLLYYRWAIRSRALPAHHAPGPGDRPVSAQYGRIASEKAERHSGEDANVIPSGSCPIPWYRRWMTHAAYKYLKLWSPLRVVEGHHRVKDNGVIWRWRVRPHKFKEGFIVLELVTVRQRPR